MINFTLRLFCFRGVAHVLLEGEERVAGRAEKAAAAGVLRLSMSVTLADSSAATGPGPGRLTVDTVGIQLDQQAPALRRVREDSRSQCLFDRWPVELTDGLVALDGGLGADDGRLGDAGIQGIGVRGEDGGQCNTEEQGHTEDAQHQFQTKG